jgi:hypothetical protein
MVCPSTDPSTRMLSPFVMALAEVELVPFWYVVEDASLTVTFTFVGVDIVKLDVDMLLTVPVDPPAAPSDRALDADPDPQGECSAVAVEDAVLLVSAAVAAGNLIQSMCVAVAVGDTVLEAVDFEEEAVAVPLLLLPQAASMMAMASRRKVTLKKFFFDSDVRINIFLISFYVYK